MERNSNNASGKTKRQQPGGMTQVRDMFFLGLRYWYWFVLSLIVTVGCAVFYLMKTPKVYTCATSIMIKSNESKTGAEEQLQELGINQSSSNMTNEILSLNTTAVASEIVRRLHLEMDYKHDGTFHEEVAYGINLPVTVRCEGLNDNETVSFHLSLASNGRVTLEDIARNGEIVSTSQSLNLGDSVVIKAVKIIVQPSSYYKKGVTDNLHVTRANINEVIALVQRKISASLREKNSTIIDIKYADVSTDRAKDILNTLVAVYNENWVKDRNRISISTSEFIKERLGVIEQELGNVDENIAGYKSEHLVPDVQMVGVNAMSQASAADQQSRMIDNQLYMANYIRKYLMDSQHMNQLLPSNSGIANTSIEQQIGEYNNLLLKRNKHLAISSAQNPLVMDLEENLKVMRRAIIHSLDNELTMLQTQQRTIQASQTQATAKIAANPMQAQYLLSVERQQKVKESLYLFLLQKREENELSQAFTAYNTRLIEPPHDGGGPVEPAGMNILLMAFGLGLLIPGGVLFLKESLNTTVRGRKDLEQMKVPFVGEIPFAEGAPKRRNKKDAKSIPPVLVEKENRNVINEAFRVVRTNLEFMLGFDGGHRIIMLTSMNPDSGKTFISANLATAFGIKEKKVIVIDLDLRKASLSRYVGKPHHGISNYLSGQEAAYKPLIIPMGCIDVLPCGTIPPNPTELLFSSRFESLLSELREQYDYIFIDCPPIEMVADASIINRHVDITLFIIRAQRFDRMMLPNVEEWYDEKKYKNLSVVLNGTTDGLGKYGYYKYGYRYGYYKYGERK